MNEVNWEAIGAIGEVLGAIGVVVTLAYLATQLRQNTRALRATSIDSATKIGNETRFALLADPDMTGIYMRGLSDVESLDPLERERFRLVMTNATWSLWNAWEQSQHGGNQAWQAQKHILRRLLTQPGGEWFWGAYGGEFDPDFQREVERVVAGETD